MFDEIESLINSSKLPSGTRTTLAVVTSAIRWLIWPFIGIGLLLNKEFFPYWLGFFIFIESVLFLTLIYILVNITKYELGLKTTKVSQEGSNRKTKSLLEIIRNGITGNLAFYIFIIAAFIILKLLGVFDNLFKIPEFLNK